ncbi:MAG: 4Fe-4S binding protein [Methanomassiliicoccus sp.]|nr:4Fe-4S binding protein [Methanomassiliicoccus sp.]
MTLPILVVGSGAAALEAAREIVVQGGRAVLVRPRGGGRSCSLRVPGGIEMIDRAVLAALEGSPGRFRAAIIQDGDGTAVDCAAVVLAPGREEGAVPAGLIALEGAGNIDPNAGVRSAAVVLDPRSPRSSFIEAVKVARRVRSLPGRPAVHLFAGEMAAYGRDEAAYRQAQEDGVVMIRITRPAEVTASPLRVAAEDQPSGEFIEVRPDVLFVDASEPEAAANVWNAGRGHTSMGALSTMRDGVFAIRPEADLLDDEITTAARAAASLAMTSAMNPVDREAAAATVDRDRCSACLTCMRVCPFRAPRPSEGGKAVVDGSLCRACGICVGACPSRAIQLPEEQDRSTERGI